MEEADDDAVEVLRDLQAEPSAAFMRRVRGSIERRRLGGQVLEMGVLSLVQVPLEYLAILLKLGAQGEEKGEPHE